MGKKRFTLMGDREILLPSPGKLRKTEKASGDKVGQELFYTSEVTTISGTSYSVANVHTFTLPGGIALNNVWLERVAMYGLFADSSTGRDYDITNMVKFEVAAFKTGEDGGTFKFWGGQQNNFFPVRMLNVATFAIICTMQFNTTFVPITPGAGDSFTSNLSIRCSLRG